jgi:hypothetical protein
VTRRISTGYGLGGGSSLASILVSGATLSSAGNENITLQGSGTGVVTTPDVVNVTNTTNATSTTTGAIKVTGGVGVAENISVGGTVTLSSGWNSGAIGGAGAQAANFTDLTSQDLLRVNSIIETTAVKTGATGTVVHNYLESNTFVHTSISANFVANFTNVPTTNNRVITFNLVLVQGAIAYYPTAIQIDGVGQTVNWLGNTPAPSDTDVINISLIRSNSAWTVTAGYSDFGPLLTGASSALAAPDARTIMNNTGTTTSGNYWINLPQLGPTEMYCDMSTAGGGWMMFGYLGSVSGIGNTQQAVFSTFGNIGTGRTSNGTSFCRFDIAKLMPGAAPGTTQMMWRRTTDANPILIHSMDELFNRAGTNPAVSSPLLNMENNQFGNGVGEPIKTFAMSNSGPAGLKTVGGARYEGGPSYPGIAWNSEYQSNSDSVGSYTTFLNRRSIWYWETNGVESQNQWSHASPLFLSPSTGATNGTGRKDFELYFRVNPLGNS